MSVEFVEVQGKTVELAVDVALAELGLESREHAEIEIVSEGKKGFLGVGGEDAIVRVRPKPKPKRRRRRRRGKGDGTDGGDGGDDRERASSGTGRGANGAGDGGGNGRGRSDAGKDGKDGGKGSGKGSGKDSRSASSDGGRSAQGEGNAGGSQHDDKDVEKQAETAKAFLDGLVTAFGLEADVAVETEKDTIRAAVTGEQAETLVGPKGSVMQAVQEVTRTVVQRRFHQPGRVRVDVAGYTERRREALAIYAERLANQVLEDGAEIMLEPMNAADRKVVHDAIGAIEGVESHSEGQEPRRSVVISKS